MSEKSTRVSGRNCRSYVQELKLFHNSGTNHRHPKGSTLWSEQRGDLYIVYSYGYHWPLYVNWKGVWFRNAENSTRTTNRHSSMANPFVPTVPISKLDIEFLVLFGNPSGDALLEAAKLKLVPEYLIPKVTAIRVGASA